MNTILPRLLPYSMVFGLLLYAAWWAGENIYQFGRESERFEWIEKTSEAERLASEQRKKLEAQIKAESEQREKNVSKAIGVYANEIEKLSSDLANAASQRMYVSTKTASCNSVGLPAAGKNEDPRRTGETVNAELSEPSATAIRGDYYAAANIELKYNMLAEIIKKSNCFEVIE